MTLMAGIQTDYFSFNWANVDINPPHQTSLIVTDISIPSFVTHTHFGPNDDENWVMEP